MPPTVTLIFSIYSLENDTNSEIDEQAWRHRDIEPSLTKHSGQDSNGFGVSFRAALTKLPRQKFNQRRKFYSRQFASFRVGECR
jgi:hypothetical protein